MEMTKVDIISGFLGAGKTTLIKKLIQDVFAGQKIVLIENEFGEIGIDGGFLKDAGINITEMNSGCICCSLVGDFGKALKEVTEKFSPDRIIIEPSGVGKLSDVRKAVENAAPEAGLVLNALTTVADASKIKMYMKNFGEFYNDQIGSAATIILSRTQKLSQEKQLKAAELIREKNPAAVIVTTPWDELTGEQILSAMEGTDVLAKMLLEEEHHHHHEHDHDHEHHDHDHEHDEHCGCEHDHEHEHHEHDHEHEHHHDHDEHCGCEHDHEHEHHEHDHEHEHHDHDHEHHHDHEHDEHCGCEHDHEHEHHEHDHDHEHHHDHDEHCGCGHDHHHHHHADEVFTSWGRETPRQYTKAEVEEILKALGDADAYGVVLRAKGMVPAEDGTWIHFDMVPDEYEIRTGAADYTGRLCVIGSGLKENALEELFHL
jgi:G3E family GTPase